MGRSLRTPPRELVLVVEHLRTHLQQLNRALAPVRHEPLLEPVAVRAYYRQDADVALLVLRAHGAGRFAPADWARLSELSRTAGLRVIVPSELQGGADALVASVVSPAHQVLEGRFDSLTAALRALARQLPWATHHSAPPRHPDPWSPAAANDPWTVRPAKVAPTVTADASGKAKGRTRGITVPGTPAAIQNTYHTRVPPPAAPGPCAMAAGSGQRSVGPGRDAANGPPPSWPQPPAPPPPIDVRVLRGCQWASARLQALNSKGAYLVTCALPRQGDLVHVALGFGGIGAMIPSTVSQVMSTEQAQQSGACGFAVKFSPEETCQRRNLLSLLRRARVAGVRLGSPPLRAAVRFPIRWPVTVSLASLALEGDALDVSTCGLFVATDHELAGDAVAFRFPLEDAQRFIHGRARIARQVTHDTASRRGLRAGYGLVIAELPARDRPRFRDFVHRVSLRSQRHVVIAAAPERMREIASGLAAAGYSVGGGSDAGVLPLASAPGRLPDAAIVDTSLAQRGIDLAWVERALGHSRIPYLRSGPEAARDTRSALDRLLRVTG